MTADVETVARGLTKAQREAVTWRQCYGSDFRTVYGRTYRTMDVLTRLGLLEETDACFGYLSPLGLAVRAYLMEQPK